VLNTERVAANYCQAVAQPGGEGTMSLSINLTFADYENVEK